MNDSKRPWARRRLHFVGVGGAGMSGYARAAHALGASVSGSDRAASVHSESLREEAVLEASIGHHAANVPDGADTEIIYSSAVPADNPERLAARRRGLADRPRAELLAELSALRRTIAVAGAHGKTTTASMIVHLLRDGGTDPGWLVGSPVGPGLANSHWSNGEWLVVEADESDRSMLSLDVEIALLTNVELDHHATFASLEELGEAFREFLAHARAAVVIWDRPDLLALLSPVAASRAIHVSDSEVDALHELPAPRACKKPTGNLEVVAYDVARPELGPGGSCFHWRGEEVHVTVPGAHNARNAAGALEVARLVGLADSARTAIAGFTGAVRRFQRLGVTASGAVVIDDYAHHPTEVAATLNAARTLGSKRLIAVFQPHLYSRTALLADEFGTALAVADVVVVLDVYPARERAEDHPEISGETLVRSTLAYAKGHRVLWRASFDEAQAALAELLEDGDLCVVMGAGDVDVLGRRLVGSDGL